MMRPRRRPSPLHPPALQIPAGLPAPPAGDAERAGRLLALLRRRIRAAGGCLPFEDYMEAVLYSPGLGYYACTDPFGEAGDFVTAPELTPLFARALAVQIAEIGRQLGAYEILEAGGGRGSLAADLLNELERLDCPPRRYHLLELSAGLRARQAATLAERAPDHRGVVTWCERLPHRLRGVVLANEVLDAMPVTRFRRAGGAVQALGVAWRGEGLAECAVPAPDALARRVAARLAGLALPEPYESELGLRAEAWVASLGECLAAGALLIIDYGFPRREFYHPQRDRGTLMCHYRHRAHGDPLALPGLQDITAHLDFTALAEAGTAAGLQLLGYTHQAAFLLGCGLAEGLPSGAADPRGRLEAAAAVKRLTLPSEMGELFKVMVLGRGIQGPLRGFALVDRRGRL